MISAALILMGLIGLQDVYSIALTVVSSLMRKYSISPASIGRLEVGTETLLDKSKSVKTVLMQLFTACGNTNVEGVDTINACYGGTNALFNAVNWIESRAWDGRDALVVAGDIAVYSKGPARPTGGAGAVAMLVGANAPIVVEPRRRGSYMQHVYDFYKPDLSSEYPVVDGKLSNECYTRALDACYSAYSKAQADGMINGDIGNNGEVNGHVNGEICETIQESEVIRPASGLDEFDYMCFHTPNCKLVAKSYARLLYNDYCSNPDKEIFKAVPPEFRKMSYEESLADRTIENIFMKLSEAAFTKRVQPSIQIPKCCGNMYTASLYSSLASLLSNVTSTDLGGKRIGLFSYGSGCASSMFSMKVVGDTTRLADAMDVEYRLQARKVATPENYEEVRGPTLMSHCHAILPRVC